MAEEHFSNLPPANVSPGLFRAVTRLERESAENSTEYSCCIVIVAATENNYDMGLLD